jgi:hypothetical protein
MKVLHNFKAQWGARAVPLCWEYRLLRGDRVPDQSRRTAGFHWRLQVERRSCDRQLGRPSIVGHPLKRLADMSTDRGCDASS